MNIGTSGAQVSTFVRGKKSRDCNQGTPCKLWQLFRRYEMNKQREKNTQIHTTLNLKNGQTFSNHIRRISDHRRASGYNFQVVKTFDKDVGMFFPTPLVILKHCIRKKNTCVMVTLIKRKNS